MALAPNPLPVPDEAGHSPSGAGGTVALAVVGGVVTTEAFRRAVLALRRQLVASLLVAWNGFIDLSDLGRSGTNFGLVGAALVDGAQRRAVAAADLFVSSALGTPPVGIDPAPFLGNPSTPLPLSVVLSGPPLATVRLSLAQGLPEEVALSRGKYRASRIAETEVSRAGNDAVVALAAGKSPGWVRHLGDQPCPICRSLATGEVQPWPEAENLSAHPLCSCVAEVVPA